MASSVAGSAVGDRGEPSAEPSVPPSGTGPQQRPWTGLACAAAIVTAIWLAAVGWRMAQDLVAPWDSKNQFYAFFRFLASAIHSGSTPFWNPYHYGGHPAIADPQSLVFAPLFVLWALFDPAPSMQAFDLVVYAHLLIGGLALAALGWRAGWPAAACVLAALVFMFGAAASGRMQHTGMIVTYAIFPVALLFLELALDRRSFAWGIAFAVAASFLALGRNQVALLFCFVLLAAAAFRIASAGRPSQYLADRLPLLTAIGIAGVVMLAAPMLLTLQFAALSNRPQALIERALESSLYPPVLATLAVPNVLGSHAWPPWGPNWELVPELASVDESFNYLFVGALPVILLLWLGVAGGRMWRRGSVLFASVLVVSLLYMLGRYTPFFPLAFKWVPGIDLFRRPLDANFVFVASLAILAGHLLASYMREGLPRGRRWALAGALVAALAVVASAVVFSARTGNAWTAAFEALKAAPVVMAIVAALVLARTAAARRIAAAAVVAIAAGELLWWNAASRMNAAPAADYAVLERPDSEELRAIEAIERSIAERHRQGERPRIEVLGAGGPWQNLPAVRGLEAINGYNPLRIGLYDRLVAPGETTYLAEQRRFPPTFKGYDTPLARTLGLEYLVLGVPLSKLPAEVRPDDAEPVFEGRRIWVYRLRNAAPRLSFATRFQVADAEALGRSGELLVDPAADRVLFDDDTPPQGAYWSLPPGQGGSARIVSWRPDRIEIEADSPAGGMLALHEMYYPGWIAEIDGEPARILRADILFRGLEVPPGRRKIVFRYAPLSYGNLSGIVRDLLAR